MRTKITIYDFCGVHVLASKSFVIATQGYGQNLHVLGIHLILSWSVFLKTFESL